MIPGLTIMYYINYSVICMIFFVLLVFFKKKFISIRDIPLTVKTYLIFYTFNNTTITIIVLREMNQTMQIDNFKNRNSDLNLKIRIHNKYRYLKIQIPGFQLIRIVTITYVRTGVQQVKLISRVISGCPGKILYLVG